MSQWDANWNKLMKKIGPTLRVNGRVASKRTQDATTETWNAAKNVLHGEGLKIQDPHNLAAKHLEALTANWYKRKLKVKTMDTHLNRIRVVCEKMNKKGLVRPLHTYFPNEPRENFIVSAVAKKSKSVTEAGVDIAAKIRLADQIDERFGMMLRVQLAFGLRRKEVLTCHPWKSTAGDDVWRVFPREGKGGRPRILNVETEFQKFVIEYVRSKLKKGERLRWQKTETGLDCTMERALEIYKRRMKQIGLTKKGSGATGHGLRAQFSENEGLRLGFVPPTLGGDGSELPKDQLDNLRLVVAESLGHSRKDITSAYYGSFNRYTTLREKEHLRLAVEEGLENLKKSSVLENPIEELQEDCIRIISVLVRHDIAINLSQAQALWRRYSSRQGSLWLKPGDAGEIERGIYVAATMHRRNGDQDEQEVPA
jgi:integrase